MTEPKKDLIEQCLLTDDEIEKAWRKHDDDGITIRDAERHVAKAQLTKAIPIIQADRDRKIEAMLSFTVRIDKNRVIVDKYDWDRFWQSFKSVEGGER